MTEYRKKDSPNIQAFCMVGEYWGSTYHWPDWLYDAWMKDIEEKNSLIKSGQLYYINSSYRSFLKVHYGYYIICHPKGTLEPVSPEFFKEIYEEIM